MTPDEIARRLAAAEAIGARAAELALHHFRSRDALAIEVKRNPQDMVTIADRAVETLIRDALAEAFPEDAQLGEEHGVSPGTSGLTWVIDPIDGTAPFLAGHPNWCVSIGALDEAGVALGVIVAPVLSESYAGARGVGARLNGSLIAVTDHYDLRTGLTGVGCNDRVDPHVFGEMLAELMDHGASWSRIGSGALMLAWVSAGRLIGYAEPRMNAWDCMAGYGLIEAAGGQVLPFPGGERLTKPAPVLGAAPHVYDELLALTRLDDDTVWGARA